MFPRSLLSAVALSASVLASSAAVAGPLVTFTAASGAPVVSGSFAFDPATRAFSSVNLQFSGTVTNAFTPSITSPFAFTLTGFGPQEVAISVGLGTVVESFFGGQVANPSGGVTDAALSWAQSTNLQRLADGTDPAPSAPVAFDWRVVQLDRENFIIGSLDFRATFDVTHAATPPVTPPGEPVAVPAPATAALLGVGLLMAGGLTRRRRAAA